MIARLRWFAAGAVAAIVAAVMLGAVTSGKLWTRPEDQRARAAIEAELRKAREALAAQGFKAPTIGPVNIPNLPQGAVPESTHAGTVPFGRPLPRPGPGPAHAGAPFPPDREALSPGQLTEDLLAKAALAHGCRPCQGWLCPEDLSCGAKVERTKVGKIPMEQLLCASSARLPGGSIVTRGEELASQHEVFQAKQPERPKPPSPRTLLGPNIGTVLDLRGVGWKIGATYCPHKLAFNGRLAEGRVCVDGEYATAGTDHRLEASVLFLFGAGSASE